MPTVIWPCCVCVVRASLSTLTTMDVLLMATIAPTKPPCRGCDARMTGRRAGEEAASQAGDMLQHRHKAGRKTGGKAHLCGAGADELGPHTREHGRQRGLQQAAEQRDVAHGAQLGEGELEAEGEEQQLHAQLGHRLDLRT